MKNKGPLAHVEIPSVIETERLELRLLTLDMVEDLSAAIHACYEEFKPWFDWVHPSLPTFEDTESFSRGNIEQQEKKEAFHYQIYLKGSSTLVGRISLDKSRPDIPSFNIGYWTHSHHTGKGYMNEAAHALCDFAIHTLKSPRLEIYHDVENLASKAVIKKLCESFGFKQASVEKNVRRCAVTSKLKHDVRYTFTQDDIYG